MTNLLIVNTHVELRWQVYLFLPVEDIATLMLVSTQFCQELNDPALWNRLLKRDFVKFSQNNRANCETSMKAYATLYGLLRFYQQRRTNLRDYQRTHDQLLEFLLPHLNLIRNVHQQVLTQNLATLDYHQSINHYNICLYNYTISRKKTQAIDILALTEGRAIYMYQLLQRGSGMQYLLYHQVFSQEGVLTSMFNIIKEQFQNNTQKTVLNERLDRHLTDSDANVWFQCDDLLCLWMHALHALKQKPFQYINENALDVFSTMLEKKQFPYMLTRQGLQLTALIGLEKTALIPEFFTFLYRWVEHCQKNTIEITPALGDQYLTWYEIYSKHNHLFKHLDFDIINTLDFDTLHQLKEIDFYCLKTLQYRVNINKITPLTTDDKLELLQYQKQNPTLVELLTKSNSLLLRRTSTLTTNIANPITAMLPRIN